MVGNSNLGIVEELAATPVREIARRDFACVQSEALLGEVVEEITNRRTGAVLVIDDQNHLLGIFTERDLALRVDLSRSTWRESPVGEVMTQSPTTVSETGTLSDVIRLMEHGSFRRIPVIDSERRAVGVLSIRDVLAHIVERFPQEFINLPPDPQHEASRRWGG